MQLQIVIVLICSIILLLFIGIFCFKELGNWKCYSWISTPSSSYRKLEVFTKNKKKKGWKRRTRFSFLNLFLLTSIKVRDTDIILLFYEKEKEKKKRKKGLLINVMLVYMSVVLDLTFCPCMIVWLHVFGGVIYSCLTWFFNLFFSNWMQNLLALISPIN